MSSRILPGQTTWSMKRDAEGHRDYTIEFEIVTTDPRDGPFVVLNTPGLYYPGATWNVDNDFDPWAWCRPDATVTPMVSSEPNKHWKVEQTFSTKFPQGQRFQRCNELNIEDPLLEPQKLNGSFLKFLKEATQDRFGNPLTNSALEQLRGQQVEFDENHPTITIEQNVGSLQLSLFASMVDTLNYYPLWGMPPRTIKLTSASWERKFYGICYVYYTRRFEFEVSSTGFDRNVLDEGTKCLRGNWNTTTGAWDLRNVAGAAPNRFNPTHFQKAVDRQNNPITVVLDGLGKPWTPDVIPSPSYIDTGLVVGRNIQPPLTNSSGISPPSGLTGVSRNTGALIDGLNEYQVTAKSVNAETTAASTGVVTANPTQSVTLSWTPVTDAISYRVYRRGPGTTTYKLIAEIKAPSSNPGNIFIQKFDESDFLLLGIPTVF